MNLLFKISNYIFFLFLCLIISGCPINTQIELRNDTDSNIYVLSSYSDYVLAEIQPQKSEKITFNKDCFRIKANEHLYEYKLLSYPEEIIKKNIFSTHFVARFNPMKEITIYENNSQINEDLYFAKSCDKAG